MKGTFRDPTATADSMFYPKPTKIGDDFTSVNTGTYHTYAVKTDGTLWAWGISAYGGVGNAILADSDGSAHLVPLPLQIGSGFWKTANGDGAYSSWALKTDGSLWAWGLNNGLLGDGTTENRLTPISIGFNVYPASGVVGDIFATGTLTQQTLHASIAPNAQDAGKSACAYIAALLPNGVSMVVLGSKGWESYQPGSLMTPYVCGIAEAFDVDLLVNTDLSPLRNSVVYLGYGVGKTPAESFADMLKRQLYQQSYVVQ